MGLNAYKFNVVSTNPLFCVIYLNKRIRRCCKFFKFDHYFYYYYFSFYVYFLLRYYAVFLCTTQLFLRSGDEIEWIVC